MILDRRVLFIRFKDTSDLNVAAFEKATYTSTAPISEVFHGQF